MQLSNLQKTFSEFFSAYLKSTSTFQQFEKKDDPHRLSISEIRDFERHGYLNV